MPEFYFDFVVSGLTEQSVGQLMIGIIQVVEAYGGKVIEEPRRGSAQSATGQPGASDLPLADRQICPAPIAHRGETT